MDFNTAECHAAIAHLRFLAGEREWEASASSWAAQYGQDVRISRYQEIERLAKKAMEGK